MADNTFDQDHDLVDHLITYRRPESQQVVDAMEELRADFLLLGHKIVDQVPRTPDRTVAIRKLHEACMATIGALALNQGTG